MESRLPPTYPNVAGKHANDAFVNPTDAIAYFRSTGLLDDLEVPHGVVLCYQRSLLSYIRKQEGFGESSSPTSFRGLLSLASTAGRVGVVGGFGYGAPAASLVLEELVALGISRFISIGTAGALQSTSQVGDLIVCDHAIRDEGVSHHYLPAGRSVRSSSELTAAFASELSSRGLDHEVGCSWTIDAPYRETIEEVRHYQQQGVLCVEMEAAGLFAVASYRSVQVASAFVISDSLAGVTWEPGFHTADTALGLQALYGAAVAVLSKAGSI